MIRIVSDTLAKCDHPDHYGQDRWLVWVILANKSEDTILPVVLDSFNERADALALVNKLVVYKDSKSRDVFIFDQLSVDMFDVVENKCLTLGLTLGRHEFFIKKILFGKRRMVEDHDRDIIEC